jgi:hypothetical protein
MSRVSDPQRCLRARLRCHGRTIRTVGPQALLPQEGLCRSYPLTIRADLQET